MSWHFPLNLPLKNKLISENHPSNRQTPIWMAHGTSDTVIALSTAKAARQTLEEAGYPLEWHEYDMAHNVCEQEIDDIRRFLLRVLPA